MLARFVYAFFPAVLVAWLLGIGAVLAQPEVAAWSKQDQEAYLAAVEDYRFSDFEAAIAALSALHQRFPGNRGVSRYLALSYEESGKYDEALDVYRAWVAREGMSLRQDMREVWLNYARVYDLAGKPQMAADILSQWLAVHPDDAQAAIIYGDMLVRRQKFDQAEQLWRRLLARPSLTPIHQASAHYYLALGAVSQGDYAAAREEAEASLKASPDGKYAPVAKELAEVRPVSRKPGLTGNVMLGEFYTSNVDLLPDVVQLAGGKKKSDMFTEADLTLGYQGSRWRFGYALNSIWHAKRKDFDLLVHSTFLDWDYASFVISPRFEYVSLNQQRLYYGGGLDVSWLNAGWLVRYQGRYREFSRRFGTLNSDLRRLGGFSNELNLSRQFAWHDVHYVLSTYIHQESTKGDATHNKTDDYTQLGLNVTADSEWKQADIGVFAHGYWRGYAKADQTILVTGADKRRDYYMQVGAHAAYRPFGTSENRIVVQGHWQKNFSNYKDPLVVVQFGKEYTEWQAGVSWQYLW